MGVVHQPVEDGIGEGGLADDLVPGVDGQLAGDEDRAISVSVLDDLHQVAPLRCSEPVRPPVVEDQQIGADDLAEQAREAAVAMGEFELGEEARQAVIEDTSAVTAGLLAEGAGEPGLSDAARNRFILPAIRSARWRSFAMAFTLAAVKQ